MTNNQLKDLIKVTIKTLNEGFLGLNLKELNDIINLNYIYGVSTLDKITIAKKHRLTIYNFILRKCRWLLDFEYPIQGRPSWASPFRHFFQSENAENSDWLYDFRTVLFDELNTFKYWINHPIKETDPPHWIENYKTIKAIEKRQPNFEVALTNLLEYVNTFTRKTAESGWNQENYPLFVSLYTTTREYGGPEEGGWSYGQMHHKASIKVNNMKEARSAALQLLKDVSKHSAWEGTRIILEKHEKAAEVKERPTYS